MAELLRIRAAQSMGEWPGERRTLFLLFGVATRPLGLRPPVARCWLFWGGPLFGSGPDDGTRRPAAEPGGGPNVVG